MDDVRTSLCAVLPRDVATVLSAVPTEVWVRTQEVRLRVRTPLTLSLAEGDRAFGEPLCEAQLQDGFVRLCGQAVHTHQAELRQGFFTAVGGFRVGVAGTAVMREGAVTSIREITSLCVRIPRAVDGCAASLLPSVMRGDICRGLLLCGAPATGKTTVLRDMARTLSASRRVAVIDERCELSALSLPRCDVLSGFPKAVGLLQAVRTLAPDVVIADEIGEDAEWQAVAQAVFCGVPVIASVHATCERELLARPTVARVLRNGGFETVAFLPARECRDQPMWTRRVEELFADHGSVLDGTGLRGSRTGGDTAIGAYRTPVAGVGGAVNASSHGIAVHGASDAGDFGIGGCRRLSDARVAGGI